MKILLAAVNAKYIHSNPAVYSLRSYVSDYQEHIDIAEYTINMKTESILADMYKRQPHVIAFSCYIWNIELIEELAAELHKILPAVPIWLGGPEVSFDPAGILGRLPAIKGVMIGEGEETFRELVYFYEEASSELHLIAGIAYRCDESVVNNSKAAGAVIKMTETREPMNMDKIPFLYRNLDAFTNRIIYYESARGCPFCCSYCLSSIDKTVRLRNLSIVKGELQYFLDQKVAQVKFVDRTFNCNHKHAMEIWQYIKENDNGVTNFHFEISADLLNKEELQLLSGFRSGLVQLEIGVQSTNPQTLEAICRSTNQEALEFAVNVLRKNSNIHIHLDLIAGLPFEDYRTFAHSFNQVYDMRPEQLQLGFLKVLKGTPIYERVEDFGINYTSKPPYEVLYSKWLPYEHKLKLKAIEEVLEIYYNSNQFTVTLPILEQIFPNPFAMYEALADYYEENDLFITTPSRVYRYEVLMQFALRYDNMQEELYTEALTYDMYLREKLKSRPGFCKDMHGFKEDIQKRYNMEENKSYFIEYAEFDRKQISKMTHMEVFFYPVWDLVLSRTRQSKPNYILFDYKERNPLTHQAKTVVIIY